MLTRTLTALTLSAATTLTYAQTSPLQPIADEGALQEPTRASSTTLPQVSLIEVLGLAARSNPLLRGARADSDASAGALMQAGVRPNPELSFLQEGFGGTERTSTATVNQRIELGGKRQARLDVASYGREVALAALDGRGSALRADVISAFYEELTRSGKSKSRASPPTSPPAPPILRRSVLVRVRSRRSKPPRRALRQARCTSK